MKDDLAQRFLNMDIANLSSIHINDTPSNIVQKLNYIYPRWIYEIQNEEYVEQDTGYFVTLVVYLPGIVKTGIGRSNVDFNKNHKDEAVFKAIKNALFFGKLDDGYSPLKQYKQQDIDYRINTIKNILKIYDNNSFLNLLKQWDSKITNVNTLTIHNAVSFIEWCENKYNIRT